MQLAKPRHPLLQGRGPSPLSCMRGAWCFHCPCGRSFLLLLLRTPPRWHLPGLPEGADAVQVYIKRDDLTGMQLVGHATRVLLAMGLVTTAAPAHTDACTFR